MYNRNLHLKIGYFADGPWSYSALDQLISSNYITVAFICARYTNPDPVLRAIAERNNIKFFSVQDVNTGSFFDYCLGSNCDLFISMSFDQILKEPFFSLPTYGTINCHAGRLPFYRGRNILNWAIINDEKEFGITVHHIDAGVDTGDIILQQLYPISDSDDYSSLLHRAYCECPRLLLQAVHAISTGTAVRVAQDSIHRYGSTFPQRRLGDELIDWNQNSRTLFNFVRALVTPGPNAQTTCGSSVVKIRKVEYIPEAPSYTATNGAILARDGTGFLIKTSDTYIKLVEWVAPITLRVGLILGK